MSPGELPNDLELLTIQAEGSLAHHGRVIGLYGLTIVSSSKGQRLWIGAAVPDSLAAELLATFDRAPSATDASQPPPALARCRPLLERGVAPLPQSAGPSFLIEHETQFASQLRIVRSDASNKEALHDANPGNWHPIEWRELLDGQLGPWTMALEEGRVVSICHTPGLLRARAAECGVWTHPAFRGRGYAAAVTSVWAGMLRPSGRHLFYSTDAENMSSQRVARRLNLRPLGWIWRLGQLRCYEHDKIHPLSTLQREF